MNSTAGHWLYQYAPVVMISDEDLTFKGKALSDWFEESRLYEIRQSYQSPGIWVREHNSVM